MTHLVRESRADKYGLPAAFSSFSTVVHNALHGFSELRLQQLVHLRYTAALSHAIVRPLSNEVWTSMAGTVVHQEERARYGKSCALLPPPPARGLHTQTHAHAHAHTRPVLVPNTQAPSKTLTLHLVTYCNAVDNKTAGHLAGSQQLQAAVP